MKSNKEFRDGFWGDSPRSGIFGDDNDSGIDFSGIQVNTVINWGDTPLPESTNLSDSFEMSISEEDSEHEKATMIDENDSEMDFSRNQVKADFNWGDTPLPNHNDSCEMSISAEEDSELEMAVIILGSVQKEAKEEKEEKVIRKLGKGAMGMVQLVKQANGDEVAVKTAFKGHEDDFAQEIKIMSLLGESPYIVKKLSTNLEQTKLKMEYVDGYNLDRYTDIVHNKGGTFPAKEYLHIFKGIAMGLEALQKSRIIHRDLTPSNIMLTKSLTHKIVDFGLAIEAASDGTANDGDWAGTPDFVAPDTIADNHTYTFKSDIFSIGITMLVCATYESAYCESNSNTGDFMKDRAKEDLTPEIPYYLEEKLSTLIGSCASFFAKNRPSATELTTQISELNIDSLYLSKENSLSNK